MIHDRLAHEERRSGTLHRVFEPHNPVADLSHERITRRPVLGSLINEYERAA
jgi:hypothetical protein